MPDLQVHQPAGIRWPALARLLQGRRFVALTAAVDALMLVCAVGAALAGASAAGVQSRGTIALGTFVLLALLLIQLRGMYRERLRPVLLDDVGSVFREVTVAAMLTVALTVFLTSNSAELSLVIARAWLFAVIYVSAGRLLLTLSQRRARAAGVLSRPTLILGAGVVGARVARRIENHPEYGLTPVGFLDPDPAPKIHVADRRAPVLGSPDDLEEVVARTGVGHVILAFSSEPDHRLLPLIRRCEELGVEVSLVPRLFDSINDRMVLEHLGGMPLLSLRGVNPQGFQFAVKHALDRAVGALLVLVFAPVMAALAIGVKLSSPGPVLYRQLRVGRDGREFILLKFRSMRRIESLEEFEPAAGLAPGGVEGSDRRTSFGRLLRRTSLDELPQLFNVLRGEMSLVGPRPERPEYVTLFHGMDRYTDRHRVRSGLTGWSQVHGYRGQTSLADRVEWDNYYIENWSLWLDFKILLMTFSAVLRDTDS